MSMCKYLPLLTALLLSGCYCGPCGYGVASRSTGCSDCDGASIAAPPIAANPLQQLANFRKSLVCGSGCGEVYYGEWTSTPPDACDPCQGGQFVGGATPYVPFYHRPGENLARVFGSLRGQRFYDQGIQANRLTSSCGCGAPEQCSTCTSAPAAVPAQPAVAPAQGSAAKNHPPTRPYYEARRSQPSNGPRGTASPYGKRPTQYR